MNYIRHRQYAILIIYYGEMLFGTLLTLGLIFVILAFGLGSGDAATAQTLGIAAAVGFPFS